MFTFPHSISKRDSQKVRETVIETLKEISKTVIGSTAYYYFGHRSGFGVHFRIYI